MSVRAVGELNVGAGNYGARVARRPNRLTSSASTQLGRLRAQAGLSQEEMARLTGMSVSSYWRLEHNTRPDNVDLRALVNCAYVLRVDVTELFEKEWLAWCVLDHRQPRPPTDKELAVARGETGRVLRPR